MHLPKTLFIFKSKFTRAKNTYRQLCVMMAKVPPVLQKVGSGVKCVVSHINIVRTSLTISELLFFLSSY